jgi:tetratricopeptide (TPR) repeat protein
VETIVFAGGSQAQSLASLYRLVAGDDSGCAEYIKATGELSSEDQEKISRADIVAIELSDVSSESWWTSLSLDNRVQLFPRVSAEFLWPFAGQPHKHNYILPGLPDGPFPAELGDAYLNRLLDLQIEPQEALRRYLAEDFSRILDLDALFSAVLERQKTRDAGTGYSTAKIISDDFRAVQLFLTPRCPARPLMRYISEEFFGRIGVDFKKAASIIDDSFHLISQTVELPIHPAVCRHFRLAYGGEDRRYKYFAGQENTFSQFFSQYLLFDLQGSDYTDDLIRFKADVGLAMNGDARIALERLEIALAKWPGLAEGHYGKGYALMRLNQVDDALAAIRRAIELDPTVARFYGTMSMLLDRKTLLDEAIEADRQAIKLSPSAAGHHAHLGVLLMRKADNLVKDAELELRTAISLNPHVADFYKILGDGLLRQGRLDEAAGCLRRALELKPGDDILEKQLEKLTLQAAKVTTAT